MDPLLKDLIAQGVLDAGSANWAEDHKRKHGGALDTALLELDLIDEDGLLKALADRHEMTAALGTDLLYVDLDVAKRVPDGFGSLFRACPIRKEGDELITLVAKPLRPESVRALRELYECTVSQRVVTTHHLTVAWNRIHQTALDERSHVLEQRLEVRRSAPSVARTLAYVSTAPTSATAVDYVLDFASRFVQFAGFFVLHDDELRLVVSSDGDASKLAAPGLDCTLGAALRHGGYFVGPLAGNPADQAFYEALGRPLPRWAFAAPVPTSSGATVVFCADNGERCLAKRPIAELTLLVSRLGRVGNDWLTWWDIAAPVTPEATLPSAAEAELDAEAAEPEHAEPEETPSEPAASEPPVSAPAPVAVNPEPRLAPEEAEVLAKLRGAALAAGMPLGPFVDSLLATKAPAPAPVPVPAPAPAVDATASLAGEVKDLFEKLATNIPAQLAQGMESAFRELVPRLQTSSVASPAQAPAPPPRAPAKVALVKKDAGPREVKSYASRRRKTKRILL